jgi:hypothetical protein
MTKMVEQVAANPLAPLIVGHSSDPTVAGGGGGYETKLLEAALSKLTGLLSVGFGEAGAGIISANLLATSATINPLLPGIRVYALFGFCDIHHFEEVNNKLGNDVLVFVNSIAEIVHSNVHSWGGQCNKNLGNAFVLVWRIGDEGQLLLANDTSIMKRQKNTGGMISSRNNRDAGADLLSSHAASFRPTVGALPSPGGPGASSSPKAADNKNGNHRVAAEALLTGSSTGVPTRPAMDLRRVPGVDVIAHGALIGFLKVWYGTV